MAGSTTAALKKVPRLVGVLAVVVVLLVAGAAAYILLGGGTKTGTAYFTQVKNVYPGDFIRILGMQVGKIDAVTPETNQVRVDFHYDSKYTLPADVKAAVVSPTLVATRYIQLAPAYTGGPEFEDGGVIPIERTASPLEFDDLKKQLGDLSDALGPNGVNKDGALNRALDTIDANGRGQGQNFHDMIESLSKAAKTVADGRDDLFGTVRNLAAFSGVLRQYDSQIVEFDNRLDDVSGILDRNSDALRDLLPKLDDAGHKVDDFLAQHGGQLTDTVNKAGSITRTLADERDNIANVLHIGPNALTNFNNIWDRRQQAVVGSLAVNNFSGLGGQGDQLCAIMTQAAAADMKKGQEMCVQYLGPVFKYLAVNSPPVNVNDPVEVTGGTSPTYGDVANGTADTNQSPNGTNSDLPRSSTANGNDRTYSGGLLGILGGGR
ncbi:MCE family protein [Pseudonocardia acidicola]|uniref:MCE family protein n=1 Tax=Pseudonocardia acidicola TaxID=2724939 RepID=A0ABX1S9N1_9PSEU|nr:MCE family protein [Pseudonocardia acidicola]NMH98273.1 MCE family protein [Pseudonocardia acidicola]